MEKFSMDSFETWRTCWNCIKFILKLFDLWHIAKNWFGFNDCPDNNKLFLDWRSYGGTRTSRLLLKFSWYARSLYLPSFMAVRAWPWRQLERRIQAHWDEILQETSEHFLHSPFDEWGGMQWDPGFNWRAWRSPSHNEAETQMVWQHHRII